MLNWTSILAVVILCACLGCMGYILLLPDLERPDLQRRPVLKHVGTLAYGVAYVLSLLRAPLGLLPYLTKLLIVFGFRVNYISQHTTYTRELLNLLGDIANLALTWFLVGLIAPSLHPSWLVIGCYLPVWAESIRLLTERVPLLFSAAWQLTPHRQIAHFLRRHQPQWHLGKGVEHYCYYFGLSDAERADFVLNVLKTRSAADPHVSERLAYLQAFRIVPRQHSLRGGLVRDVARGEVFIHAIWTNDPWLLAGMALRRSPWTFDPRYLQRPFCYMSQANRAMSLFILQNARYCFPYALFQFGHEIRVARLHCFYVILRWLGASVERKVEADSTFQYDQFIFWLKKVFGHEGGEARLLSSDEEAIAELSQSIAAGARFSAQEIAQRYTYPVKYVEEVLLPRIVQIQVPA